MSGTTTLTSAPAPAETAPAAPATPAPTEAAPAAPAPAPTPVAPVPPTEAPPPAPVVPEAYEFKAPDGMQIDPKQVEAFTPVAKKLGLTQDQAQELATFQLSQAKAANDAAVATVTAWGEAAKADKEYGGQAFAESLAVSRKALDKYATPELRKALDDTGMGNHPEVVRLFYRVGKAMADDTMASGQTGGGSAPKSLADRMFPNHK